jgi:alkylresorcinol/alkylpyrone synthase
MAAPKIAAVATATPPWRYDQATVLRMSGYDDPRRMGFFSNSLIETRHLYMDPETFTPDESVDQLNERWRRGAVEVGKAAVARAIEQAGWQREDVDFLATTTCTGRVCPSLDAQIINELGLRSTIQRVHVGDTGCASAVVALQQAHNHLRAFPDHRAVVVAVELCSTAY